MTSQPLTVNCPGCGARVEWRTDNPWRPFCSQRCKDGDFIAWANEEQVIPGNSQFDDLLSGDLEER